MRQRGAKVTDIIVIVISCVEGIQQQTVEVIKLSKWYGIPVVVALNKVDRDEANPDQVIMDLANHGLELDEVGGDIPSARISGLKGTGLDVIEDKIIKVAKDMKLFEDRECDAQCFVVETKFDEQTNMIQACVVVKKGILKQENLFVCGISDGRVRYMLDDFGNKITKAFPGQAVTVSGFKTIPDVGQPLYVVKSPEEAEFIRT